jgi:hypothetical protein
METEAKTERPEFVTDKHLVFLDNLRESGKTNMFGATPYLQKAFKNLTRDESVKVLSYWMNTFSERHPR